MNRERPPTVAAYVAFGALVLLAGPAGGFAGNAIGNAFNGEVYAGAALATLIGGCLLLAYAITRRQRMPRGKQWGVLLLLLVPQWCWSGLELVSGRVSWLHSIGEGAVLLIAVAAPLWLGLVAALDIAEIEVPVACVVSALAGMFAVMLVVPANSYGVRLVQAPMLAVGIGLGVATALAWAVARRNLAGLPIASSAGAYLLLSAIGSGAFSWMRERSSWQLVDWHAAVLPVASEAALVVALWCLWFWLLQRITLGAFGMQALAAWGASAIPVLATVGLLQWRVDVALVIAMVACASALRARAAEEQPTLLGLREP